MIELNKMDYTTDEKNNTETKETSKKKTQFF